MQKISSSTLPPLRAKIDGDVAGQRKMFFIKSYIHSSLRRKRAAGGGKDLAAACKPWYNQRFHRQSWLTMTSLLSSHDEHRGYHISLCLLYLQPVSCCCRYKYAGSMAWKMSSLFNVNKRLDKPFVQHLHFGPVQPDSYSWRLPIKGKGQHLHQFEL